MPRALDVSSKITLYSGNTATEFTINNIAGLGGSCIAYNVSYPEGDNIIHKGILKEYCPAFLDKDNSFERIGTSIIVPDEHAEFFEAELQRFRDTYYIISAYLSSHEQAVNYHPVLLGLYEGNNTLYTLSSFDYGLSYDKVEDKDLCSILRLMLSVTKAVELYHDAGFLHLDIKPRNILILHDVTDIIKLFDFDSLTSIEGLRNGTVVTNPVPEDYHVPELAGGQLRNIGIHTDIFEIGAMLFCRVFGRAPQPADMERGASFDFDSSRLLNGISPRAKSELENLFRHTMQIARAARYRTTAELKEQLSLLISLVGENAPYIMDMPRWQPTSHVVGRQDEIKEIKRRLDNDGYVFIRGIGGLGKSELSKLFVSRYAETYHTVQFCKYSDDLRSLIAAIPVAGINDNDYANPDALVKEKLKILHNSDEHTLLIVDNFNTTHDRLLRDFLPGSSSSFKVIFTTRCVPAADYYADKVYELPCLSPEDCTRLFCRRSGLEENAENRTSLLKIIDIVKSNTLVLVLLAESLRKTGMSPWEVIWALENQNLAQIDPAIFHEYDYENREVEEYTRIYSHLNTIFSVSRLTPLERTALKNMSLVSQNGIDIQDFIDGCEHSLIDRELILALHSQGWIDMSGEEKISMHPIVSDLIADNGTQADESYYNLFDFIYSFCDDDTENHFSYTLERFAGALQLHRRSRGEEAEIRINCSILLSSLYMNTDHAAEARNTVNEALTICQKEKLRRLEPDIYLAMAVIEKWAGTPKDTIRLYETAERKAFMQQDIENVLYAIIGAASCYADNSEYQTAFREYERAHGIANSKCRNEILYYIAVPLAEVCEALGMQAEREHYSQLAEQYRLEFGIDDSPSSFEEEVSDLFDDLAVKMTSNDYQDGLRQAEQIIESFRDEYGEDSPTYNDIKSTAWMYYAAAGDRERTMRIIGEHLARLESTHGKRSMAMANYLGEVAILLSDVFIEEAPFCVNCANTAVSICEELGDTHVYAYCQSKLALAKIYMMRGEKNTAAGIVESLSFSEFSGTEYIDDIIENAGGLLLEITRYDLLQGLCSELLRKLPEDDTRRCRIYLMMSMMSTCLGDIEAGEKYILAAEKYFPSLDNTNFNTITRIILYNKARALLFHNLRDFSSAAEAVTEIIENKKVADMLSYLINTFYLMRGNYYCQNDEFEKASEDFKTCERILRENGFSEEGYVGLYNNVAVNYLRQNDYSTALDYLYRIVRINPNTTNITSQFDGVVCLNIGRALSKLKRYQEGDSMLLRAIAGFRRVSAETTYELYYAKRNLTESYYDQGRFDEAINMNLYHYQQCVKGEAYCSSETNMLLAFHLAQCYLAAGKPEECYDFMLKAEKDLAELFGEINESLIEFQLRAADLCRANGYREFVLFADRAYKNILAADLEHTLYNVRALNYLGCYFCDAKEDYREAMEHFTEARDIMQELSLTQTPLYEQLLQNIDYADNKLLGDLIGGLLPTGLLDGYDDYDDDDEEDN